MNVAGPSALLLRCCRASTSSVTAGRPALLSQQLAHLSTSSSASDLFPPQKAPSRHKTPKGTNAKPAAKGRPNRYPTRYGVPPLHPSLLKTGSEALNRDEIEKSQRPDFEKIWALEDDIATATSDSKKQKAIEELKQLRQNQPWRHPLWAFFHEKTEAEYKEEMKMREEQGVNTPGKYSLAYSLETPDRLEAGSGRPWHAAELRRKSFDDLHKLWLTLSIERNALYTQRDEAKRWNLDWSSYTHISEKLHRVRKSMARIKYVIHERRVAAAEAQQIIKDAAAGETESTEALEAGRTESLPASQSLASFTESEPQAVPAATPAA